MKFKKTLSLMLAGCMLAGMAPATIQAGKPDTNVVNLFSDIDPYAWYVEGVQYAFDNGLMSGYRGEFTPNDNMNRAMMVTTLYRLDEMPEVTDYTASNMFNDVEVDSWYEDAVNWAYNEKITTGYAGLGLFGTEDNVTREQLAVFLYRYAEQNDFNVSKRQDITGYKGYYQISDYAKEAMSWAVAAGLISGSQYVENNQIVYDLDPQGSATRAQLATILMRFADYCEENIKGGCDFNGVEIKVFGGAWNSVEDTDDPVQQKAIQFVEKKYNIKFVKAELDSPESTWDDQIITSILNGDPCVDIITLNPDCMLGCMMNGVLYDMTDNVAELDVKPVHTQAGTWQGKCYGVSYDDLGDSWVLVYDRDYLEEIGMEKTPTDMFMEGNWSYEDFEAYCADMKAKLPEGVYPIGQYPFHWGVMSAGANGTAISDMDCNLGLMDETYIEALEFYADMEKKGLAFPMQEVRHEEGYIIAQDIAYAVSDERIVMKRAEAWQLGGLGFNYGVVFWPWGSNVTCEGDYTTLSDNYKVSQPYWSVDSIIKDSCDRLGIPGEVMMKIIYDYHAAIRGDAGNKFMHEDYKVSKDLFSTEQDAELYQWGGSRIQFDTSWAMASSDIFSAWKQTGDVLLRYYDVRSTNESYYNQAKAALADAGITIS